jgi:hypothetical protein
MVLDALQIQVFLVRASVAGIVSVAAGILIQSAVQ